MWSNNKKNVGSSKCLFSINNTVFTNSVLTLQFFSFPHPFQVDIFTCNACCMLHKLLIKVFVFKFYLICKVYKSPSTLNLPNIHRNV